MILILVAQVYVHELSWIECHLTQIRELMDSIYKCTSLKLELQERPGPFVGKSQSVPGGIGYSTKVLQTVATLR